MQEYERSLRTRDPNFKITLHTEDALLCPIDTYLSIELSSMMAQRGIEVFVDQKLENLHEEARTLFIKNKDGTTAEEKFTNLILEPSAVPHKLVTAAGRVNPETLETEDGTFVVGKALKQHFPIMNRHEIDKQADVVDARLTGIDARNEYSPEFVINTGVNSALVVGLDKDGRLKYKQSYAGLSNTAREAIYEVSKVAEIYKRKIWY